MRQELCLLLAKYAGQELTRELAADMVRELCPDRRHDPAQFGQKTYQDLTFQAERFTAALPELHVLHLAHWAETERARHGLAMNPDYAHMADAEERGELLQFTARAGNRLVGNIRLYLYRDLHTQTLAAKEDTFFLLPKARRGWTALRFWQFAERAAASLGVLELRTDSKVLHDADGAVTRDIGKLNQALGYQHVSNGYLKRLAAPTSAPVAPLEKD